MDESDPASIAASQVIPREGQATLTRDEQAGASRNPQCLPAILLLYGQWV